MSSGNSDPLDLGLSSKPDKRAPRDEQWAYIQKAVAYIMDHPEGIAGLGYAAAMNISTVIFEFCSKKGSPFLNHPPQGPGIPEPELYEQLYERLVGFLHSYFDNIYLSFEALRGLDLLTHYADQCDRAFASAKQLDRTFNYLNRQRVSRNPNPKDFGKYQGVEPPKTWIITVQTTVFDAWTSRILTRLQQDSSKFTNALIDVAHSQSEVKEEDAALIKKILESLITLDGSLTNPIHQSTLYQDYFQAKFLSNWDVFCLSKKAEVSLSTDEKVEPDSSVRLKNILKLEMDKMASYLPESTQKELLATAERITDNKNDSL